MSYYISINTSLAILAVSFFNPVGYFDPDRGRRVKNVLRKSGKLSRSEGEITARQRKFNSAGKNKHCILESAAV